MRFSHAILFDILPMTSHTMLHLLFYTIILITALL